MAVDNATRALIAQMAAARGKPIHEGTVQEARDMMKAAAAVAGPAPKMLSVEDHQIPAGDATIAVRVLVPPQGARALTVFLHGGGWVIGSIDDYETMARKLAERTSSAIALVEYRLAPEHRYPTAVDDCWAATLWAAARTREITGRDRVPFLVAGDSAGGNLTAVMAQRARDRGGPRIDLQVMIYPVTDHDTARPSYVDPENQLLLTRESMVWFWDHYVPDASRRGEPDVSPLRAESLAGLAPAVVLTAEHDVLRDEGEAYAEAMRAAGVPVDFKRHVGQTHGFFTMLALPGSERGFQHVVQAMRACIVRHSNEVSV